METGNTLHVPAREIPIPEFLSPTAKAVLSAPSLPPISYPEHEDHQGWLNLIEATNRVLYPLMEQAVASVKAEVTEQQIGEANVFDIMPESADPNDRTVVLDMHGGGLYLCAGELCKMMGIGVAEKFGRRVWSVDYRMPPNHPYPAALDDGIAAYKALLKERAPHEIIISGASAGGNLAAALTLRIRDSGLPMPAAVYLSTPEIDLTESGDSFNTNEGVDKNLRRLMPANLLYANGHDLTDPYLSPLFADFTKGFPPTLLVTGTRDLFLSNTVRMHRALRAADIRAELHVAEAGGHGNFPLGSKEDDDITKDIRLFVESVLNSER